MKKLLLVLVVGVAVSSSAFAKDNADDKKVGPSQVDCAAIDANKQAAETDNSNTRAIPSVDAPADNKDKAN